MGEYEQIQAAWQALHDPASGMPSEPLVHDRLRQALALARREALAVTLMLFSWDEPAGDQGQLAALVYARLAGSLRSSDTVGMLGGRLAVVLPNANDQEVPLVAGRLIIRLLEPFQHEGRLVPVRAAAGLAVAAGGDRVPDAEALYSQALDALQQAQLLGGGFVTYDSAESQALADAIGQVA